MAVGANANVGLFSYLAVGVEATFKTYNTCTAGLDFLSFSMKTTQEIKAIEAVQTSRTYSDKISLSKSIEGDVEFYMAADSDAAQRILQNAMGGGTITTATASGDTTGGGVLTHVYSVNDFSASFSSLCLNARKGDSTNGKSWGYNGVRVGELTLSGEVDEALKCSASMIACDSTTTITDVSSVYPVLTQDPMVFSNMRLSIENTFASLTSAAFWHVQSFEWGVANNLKADSSSRRIGTNILDVLPPGVAAFTFNFSMRFDTLTAYSAMLAETQLSAQIVCEGNTYSGSSIKRSLKIDMPVIYIADAGDPEVGGPDEVLVAEVTALVLRDVSSATGYAAKISVNNKTTTYN